MRKIFFYPIIMLLLFNNALYSQVGINTPTPASTLEVVAKSSTGTTTNVDGLLIPRVDRQRAQSMTTVPTSTLIYVNSVATGAQLGTAINIDAVGYYFYDGTAWVKINDQVNIYTNNGSLKGNRIVTQGANTLAFTASAVNAFSVDNTTFSVDATNKRIGIGTTAPKQQIHITESGANSGITTSFISGLAVTGTAAAATSSGPGFYLENTSAAAGSKLLKMNYSLNATEPILNFQAVSDDATTALLQILTLTRSAKLGINATPNPASNLSVNGNAAIGNGYTTTVAPTNGAIIQGNVGIGTTAPTSMLSVNGTADKPGGGTWGTFSDKRVKKDINDFKDGLNVISQLHPVTYKYNEKSGYNDLDKEYVGFVAQEVEKAAPYMVKITDDSTKSGLKDKRELDESALTKILVNAVKELEKQVKDLQMEVQSLKSQKKN